MTARHSGPSPRLLPAPQALPSAPPRIPPFLRNLRNLRIGPFLLLALLALGVPARAQEATAPADSGDPSGYAAELSPEQPSEEAAETVTVSTTALSELVHAISSRLSEDGTLPEWGRIPLSDGDRARLSAADVFVVLTRAAETWYEEKKLPASISVQLGATDPPLLDAPDYPTPTVDLEKGRAVKADQFLSFAGETLRWVVKFHRLPTAVWVGGERLSAAEYLAGLAICLDYASTQGQLGESLFLPAYSPPLLGPTHRFREEREPGPRPCGRPGPSAARYARRDPSVRAAATQPSPRFRPGERPHRPRGELPGPSHRLRYVLH